MIKNANFSGYYFYVNKNIWRDFQICVTVPIRFHNGGRNTFVNTSKKKWFFVFLIMLPNYVKMEFHKWRAIHASVGGVGGVGGVFVWVVC